ncbi:MAG: glycosyltransferase family protein [Alphaproteobacteria bacterium]
MSVVTVIQVRTNSCRLPKKALLPLGDTSVIGFQIGRLYSCKGIGELVVATTTKESDDVLAQHLKSLGVRVFRGSEKDVLNRFYQCAKLYDAEIVVRLTGDDPFKDPSVVMSCLKLMQNDRRLDYASNTMTPTYPEGIDVEVISMSALSVANAEAELVSDREHVTPFIWRNKERFKTKDLKSSPDLSKYRLTVDYQCDYEVAKKIAANFSPRTNFSYLEIIRYLETDKSLQDLNGFIKRNEGYLYSLAKELE